MSFCHLHVHTEYSLLDGACRIEPMLDKIKSMGQTSVAMTDHGVLYGCLNFYKAAKDRGIKPIIGCEVYVAPRTRFDKVSGIDSERYHLILLCENNTGYKNLMKIVSESFVNGFYTKPRVDKDLLKEYHEGLIALSGCFFGELSQNLSKGNYEDAINTAKHYQQIFGKNNYFIEIQNHSLPEQQRILPDLIRISEELGIPVVATNDAHYINREDSEVQKLLICIQTNKTINEDTGFDFSSNELYLKSEEEMLETFKNCRKAVENTALISERCNVEIEFGNTKLPHFDVPDGYDHVEWFNLLCRKGLTERYGPNPPQEYKDRMEYELNIINSMGYTDYYLIVYDFIHFAKSHGIPVGPGRGSGAASICAYCIGITDIEPMKYGLLFERFLNPERVSMPDFDVDFCYIRRQEVINYVIDKYGYDHVAQIVTFGTLAAKAAIHDVGRVLSVSYSEVDKISKMVPNELDITIASALEKSRELKELYETDSTARKVLDYSMKIEGIPRHTSTHAAGVVITADPVNEYVPLAKNDESIVTQYTMKGLEKLGLLKMDFLGLRTLTVIDIAVKSIREKIPGFDLEKIAIDDPQIYRMFARGETDGVFQFESSGMKNMLRQLNPDKLEDLIAANALYRPGPEKFIPLFIRNKNNPKEITYVIPALKPILDITNGCIVYQEQVMQICREIAGYSYGRADLVRRAMAKKQHDVMLKERDYFINGQTDENGNVICEGAVRRGVSKEKAGALFDEMISFASYAFNKAHAAAYTYLAYQTAYLKYYYPKEYFASVMTSNSSKVTDYINICSSMNIKILPPHINVSTGEFKAVEDGISFSLSAVKNIGGAFIDKVIAERSVNGPFKDLYDFCVRMYGRDLNRRAIESLIKCGAFDGLGANRRQMIIAIDSIFDELNSNKRRNIEGQIGFGDISDDNDLPVSGGFKFEEADEYTAEALLRYEKEVTGLYISGHPLDKFSDILEQSSIDKIDYVLSDSFKKQNAMIAGLITTVTKKTTRNNTVMAFIQLEDKTGSTEIIVFSNAYDNYRQFLYEGNTVIVNARVQYGDNKKSIICDYIEPITGKYLNGSEKEPDTVKENKSKAKGLFVRFDNAGSPQVKVCRNLISIFDGTTDVFFYYCDTKKYEKVFLADVNDALLKELRKILGNGNIVYNE